MTKGIIINMLCTNPDCTYSTEKLVVKQALQTTASTGRSIFTIPRACPRCKAPIEMLNFVSGTVEIQKDKINQNE